MLVYPITYTILVLPLSIGRWATFTNVERPSNGANYDAEAARHSSNKTYLIILIGICIFGLSGVANVILFMVTRPKLLSLNGSQDPSTPSISTHAGAHLGPRSSVVYGSRRKSLIPPRSHHDPADTKSSHIGDVVVLDTFTPRSGSFTEEERDRKSPHRGTEHDLSPSLYESSRTRTPSRKMFSRAAISSRPPSPTLSDDDEERPSDRRVDMLTFLKNEGRKRTPEGAAPTYPPPAIVASGPTFTGPPVMTPRTPAAVNVEVTVERSYM